MIGTEDQQLADDIFKACFPSGGAPPLPNPASTPPWQQAPAANKRQRSDQATKPFGRRGPRFPAYQARISQSSPFQASTQLQLPAPPPAPMNPEAMSLITRMLLRHEDSINLAALDRGLVVLIKQDRQSILPSMLQAAKVWRESETDSLERTQPLRTVLLACLIRELLQRLQTVRQCRPLRKDEPRLSRRDGSPRTAGFTSAGTARRENSWWTRTGNPCLTTMQ